MTFVYYVFTLFGFCYIVGHSVITLPLRKWIATKPFSKWPLTLIECPACMSFWIGLAVGIWYPVLPQHPIMFALLSCGTSAFLGLVSGLME